VRRTAATGLDAERVALARAVRWHAEHRVLLDGRHRHLPLTGTMSQRIASAVTENMRLTAR
jgi:hypothetical protein